MWLSIPWKIFFLDNEEVRIFILAASSPKPFLTLHSTYCLSCLSFDLKSKTLPPIGSLQTIISLPCTQVAAPMGQWLKAPECGALPLGAAGYPLRARGTVYFAARGQFLSPKAFMLLWHQDPEVGRIDNGQGVDWKGVGLWRGSLSHTHRTS